MVAAVFWSCEEVDERGLQWVGSNGQEGGRESCDGGGSDA